MSDPVITDLARHLREQDRDERLALAIEHETDLLLCGDDALRAAGAAWLEDIGDAPPGVRADVELLLGRLLRAGHDRSALSGMPHQLHPVALGHALGRLEQRVAARLGGQGGTWGDGPDEEWAA